MSVQGDENQGKNDGMNVGELSAAVNEFAGYYDTALKGLQTNLQIALQNGQLTLDAARAEFAGAYSSISANAMQAAQNAQNAGSVAEAGYWERVGSYYGGKADDVMDPLLDANQAFQKVADDFNAGSSLVKKLGGEVVGPLADGAAIVESLATGNVDPVGNAIAGMAITGALAGIGLGVAAIAGVAAGPVLVAAGLVAALINLAGADEWLWDNILKDIFKKISDHLTDAIFVIDDFVRDLFDQAKQFVPRRDPLTLDLDGDGIEERGQVHLFGRRKVNLTPFFRLWPLFASPCCQVEIAPVVGGVSSTSFHFCY